MMHLILLAVQSEPAASPDKLTDILLAAFTFCLVVVGVLQYLLVRSQDEHFENSERAWLLAHLGPPEGEFGQITNIDSRKKGIPTSKVEIRITLTCRNEGKSPAWVSAIWWHLAIMKSEDAVDMEPPTRAELIYHGALGPIGADKEAKTEVKLTMERPEGVGGYHIFILVEYKDIFKIERKTTLGYTMNMDGDLMRPNAFTKRNTNT